MIISENIGRAGRGFNKGRDGAGLLRRLR